jgi:hypothetical protein
MELPGVGFRLPGSIDPIKQRQEFVVYWYDVREPEADQLFRGSAGEEAKRGVDIADDVIGPLQCGYWDGRSLCERPAAIP